MEQSTGRKKVSVARSQVVLNEPFWSRLVMKFEIVEDPKARKFWTDGVHIGFNPDWVKDAPLDEVIARIIEMTGHVANEHELRIAGMDPYDGNKAADYTMWGMMKNAGYPMPNDVFYEPAFNGKALEWVYAKIHKEPPPAQPQAQEQPGDDEDDEDSSGAGQGQPGPDPDDEGEPEDGDGDGDDDGDGEPGEPADPGSDGEVRPPPAGVDKEELQEQWRESVLQAAAAAEAIGKLPAGIKQLVERISKPVIPWQEVLRKKVQQIITNTDYSWTKPNRRFVQQGLYLPHMRSERMPAGVILWDTSGSMDDQKSRAKCAAECAAIIDECRPEKLYVMYVDAEVQNVDVFEPGDKIEFHPVGGGGTNFVSAFQRVEDEGWEPSFFIGITDLYATFPKQEPDGYPVIWCATTDRPAPFGEVIRLPEED